MDTMTPTAFKDILEHTQDLIDKRLLLEDARDTPNDCNCKPGEAHSGKCKL